jgi:hypothetical protein
MSLVRGLNKENELAVQDFKWKQPHLNHQQIGKLPPITEKKRKSKQ